MLFLPLIFTNSPPLIGFLAFFNFAKIEFNEDEETITLCGPKHNGRWTDSRSGQSEFAGISKEGIDRFNALKTHTKQGRTPEGLAVEKAFLTKLRAGKGITEPTHEEEKKKRRRSGRSQQVADAPPMDEATVEEQFDE